MAFPLDPLDKSKDSETAAKGNRYQTQQVGDGIHAHVYTGQPVECPIDGRKSNGGLTGADCLHIDKLKGNRPQHKCSKQT